MNKEVSPFQDKKYFRTVLSTITIPSWWLKDYDFWIGIPHETEEIFENSWKDSINTAKTFLDYIEKNQNNSLDNCYGGRIKVREGCDIKQLQLFLQIFREKENKKTGPEIFLDIINNNPFIIFEEEENKLFFTGYNNTCGKSSYKNINLWFLSCSLLNYQIHLGGGLMDESYCHSPENADKLNKWVEYEFSRDAFIKYYGI